LVLTAAVVWAGSPARGGELTAKERAAGRKVYVAKCAKCHKFYEPKGYSDADWQRWLESMSRKSKLKTEDERLLRRYLDEYRAGGVRKRSDSGVGGEFGRG
jgi:cytochrome c553